MRRSTTSPLWHNTTTSLNSESAPSARFCSNISLPAIIAMVASSLYNIVDAIFIGQSVGKFAIAGLALTNPLMALTAASARWSESAALR